MKIFTRIILLSLLSAFACGNLQAKSHNDKSVYAFAYGTCFNDSTVYLSAIYALPEGKIDERSKFLSNRAGYSAQFKAYLDAKDFKPHTCTIIYSTKKSSLEKQLAKLRHRCKKNKETQLVEVSINDFNFKAQ